ncbi:fungal-specific transcription factor domain-containing protein [Fusarium oxysporum Fo47]|uniref:fungal-specific transcription factor domain-containing protein n=1 Tax=Fusarium oxysporum Fo47 TaxID=660027 RepID=UPI002869E188|nr:fungal-specific transcription factor domain-containing protein [Fusarium oxysporum Fo47]QKD59138.2 fungal-specific transcription factor domain-domain-containing protein [Fusarium oxysporum Fo47]
MYGADDELSLAVDAFLTEAMGRKQTQSQGQSETSRRGSAASQPAPQSDKSFECTHPGCSKKFTRSEHLQRHALNHLPGGSSCDICRAHFKRPDLLRRHMERHRQKDLEAGGTGFGVLDTRKRSWEAPDGTVVEKRPCRNSNTKAKSTKGSGQNPQETQQVPSPESDQADNTRNQSPGLIAWGHNEGQSVNGVDLHPSSDLHIEDSIFVHSAGELVTDDHLVNFTNSTDPFHHGEGIGEFSFDQLDPLLLNESFVDTAALDYTQNFQPDTASSFNMPYTTALDYNWLFNMNLNPTPTPLAKANEQYIPSAQMSEPVQILSPDSINSTRRWSESVHSHSSDTRQDASDPRTAVLNHTKTTPESLASSRTESTTPAQYKSAKLSRPNVAHDHQYVEEPQFNRPFSMLEKGPSIPKIDESVRKRILQVVEAANPSLPDSRHSLWDEPLLSRDSLQTYLELFFVKFNTAYPLMHLATFDVSRMEPLLLISVILLGATYSTKDAHQLAVCIHDVIRPSIFSHASFSARAELWTLQTILLVECFGKSRAGQKQHDMSHLFHGLLINLIRRSDCQSVRPQGPPADCTDSKEGVVREAWRRWAIAEQKKRQVAQPKNMGGFRSNVLGYGMALISLQFPADLLPSESQILSRTISAASKGIDRIVSPWDMQRRDQTALGVVDGDGPGSNWRKLIGNAYDAWKEDFDAYITSIISRLQNTPEDQARRSEYVAFATAYNALFHSAQALLHMEFLDIQIYAGARHILGRPVQQKDYRRSAKAVKQWASLVTERPNKDQTSNAEQNTRSHKRPASIAAWHAARLLHENTKVLTRSDAMQLFHVPWCLYLATLACWAFCHGQPNRGGILDMEDDADDSDDDSDEIIWNPRGEMHNLVSRMAQNRPEDMDVKTGQQRQIVGLVWTMAETLSKVRTNSSGHGAQAYDRAWSF